MYNARSSLIFLAMLAAGVCRAEIDGDVVASPAGGSNYYYYGACAVGCVAVGGVAYFCLKSGKKSDKSEEKNSKSTSTNSGSTWELPKTVKIDSWTDETGSTAVQAWDRLNNARWYGDTYNAGSLEYLSVPGGGDARW